MIRTRSAGFSLLESTIALAVVAMVAGTFLWGAPDQVRATSAAFRASAAHRIATGVLETAGTATLTPGTVDLPVPPASLLSGAEVTRVVREREPGLLEVEAIVRWSEPGESDPRESRLVTLVAVENDQ